MKDKFVTDKYRTVNINGIRVVEAHYINYAYCISIVYDGGQVVKVEYKKQADCDAMYDKIVAALGAAPEAVTFLPCSHCGREPFQAPQKDVVDGITGGYHVWCWNCKARGPREATPAKAIAAWNRRA